MWQIGSASCVAPPTSIKSGTLEIITSSATSVEKGGRYD